MYLPLSIFSVYLINHIQLFCKHPSIHHTLYPFIAFGQFVISFDHDRFRVTVTTATVSLTQMRTQINRTGLNKNDSRMRVKASKAKQKLDKLTASIHLVSQRYRSVPFVLNSINMKSN